MGDNQEIIYGHDFDGDELGDNNDDNCDGEGIHNDKGEGDDDNGSYVEDDEHKGIDNAKNEDNDNDN